MKPKPRNRPCGAAGGGSRHEQAWLRSQWRLLTHVQRRRAARRFTLCICQAPTRMDARSEEHRVYNAGHDAGVPVEPNDAAPAVSGCEI